MGQVLRIFRVVDASGAGMYTGNVAHYDSEGVMLRRSLWEAACMKNEFSPVHPAPQDDGIFDFSFSWLFAFQSMDLLQKWIYKTVWIENMHKLGARVICFTVVDDKVIRGNTQCVFDPTWAIQEYSLPIKEAIEFEESRIYA